MTTKHGIALVGLGMVSGAHARSLQDLSDRVEVVCAHSRSPERRDAFAKAFPFPTVDRLEAVLADERVRSVIVITPANTHGEIVEACARAGKNVLLEKPVEITTERASALVEACERADVTLGIVLQHRFRPAGERLREVLAEGKLGEILSCSTAIDLWRPQSYYDEPGRGSFARDGGGVLISQGIHTLDLMLSLAGPIASVQGTALTTPIHAMETEDMVSATVRFANGAVGTIEATTAAYPGFAERVRFICRHGTALLEGTGLTVAYHDGTGERVAPIDTAGGTGANPMDFPHDWHRSVIADFLDAVETGRPPRVTGREALRVHRLIDALVATGGTDGAVAVAGETA